VLKPAKALPNIRLSDTQLIALSKAVQREDGAIVLSERLTGSAAKRRIDALIDKGLAREIRAKVGMPIVRRDEDKGAYALIITKTGRAAINADDDLSEKGAPATTYRIWHAPSTELRQSREKRAKTGRHLPPKRQRPSIYRNPLRLEGVGRIPRPHR
jgi:hypothetical protein